MLSDSLLIVCISVVTALLAEGLTWLLVYRTEKYKKLKSEVDKQSKKLEKRKEVFGELTNNKNRKRRLNLEEERLKSNNRDLSSVRMKSMFAIGFCFTALLGTLNSILRIQAKTKKGLHLSKRFEGRVVAKLPFVPIGFFQGLSHRGLSGDDYTDCSFIFLYILCTMSIRQNIQKLLGFAPSRASAKQAGGLFQPPQSAK